MRVAFVHFYTLRLLRGIETLILSLANCLVERGVEASILTARRQVDPLVKPDPRVRLKEFPTFRYYSSKTIVPFYLAHLIKDRYDIVTIFFSDFGEGPAINLASRFADFKLNLYLCYPYEAAPHRYHSFARYGLAKKAHRLMADSNYAAESARHFFGREIAVVPAGTDPNRFYRDPALRAKARKRLGLADDAIVLLNVSALEERKGIHRVLQALPLIKCKFPGMRYVLLGRGPYRSVLEGMVHDLQLSDNVIFAGTASDLAPYYNLADIFVLLSDAEANSVACMEAMACELPVVVANRGGFVDVVDPSCGRLVGADRPQEVASALLELAADAPLCRTMGAAGRRAVLERMSWDKSADKLLAIFEEELRQ